MSSLQSAETSFERLPANVVPKKYILTLEPDLEKFTFTGIEHVLLDVKEETDKIILNASELSIDEVSYELPDGSEVIPQNVSLDQTDERLTITFASILKPGSGTLHISYKGILNDKLKGFYRAKYPSTDGKSPFRYVAVTQFASTYARYAFPSWDEPAVKSIFRVTLITPKDALALSNMSQVGEIIREDGKHLVTFYKIPIMYQLICWHLLLVNLIQSVQLLRIASQLEHLQHLVKVNKDDLPLI